MSSGNHDEPEDAVNKWVAYGVLAYMFAPAAILYGVPIAVVAGGSIGVDKLRQCGQSPQPCRRAPSAPRAWLVAARRPELARLRLRVLQRFHAGAQA